MRDYEEKSYYEIQLDNKQLILVFFAAVTVCVLIFVLGVMIGKGQKEAEMAATPSKNEAVAAEPDRDTNPPKQAISDMTADEKETKPEKQVKESSPKPTYAYEDLDKPEARPEPAQNTKTAPSVPKQQQQAAVTKQQQQTAAVTKEQQAAAVKKEEPKQVAQVAKPAPEKSDDDDEQNTATAPVDPPEPAAEKPDGKAQFTVQVMATSSRSKAEQQVSVLKAKGYTPRMDESFAGSGRMYKVRVGKFVDSGDAKALASRLKSDLHIDTWVAVLD